MPVVVITAGAVFIFPIKHYNNMAQPIWQDYQVTLGSTATDSIPFAVMDSTQTTTLYEGTAYTRPSGTIPTAKVNDIIAAQLVRGLTIIGDTDVPAYTAAILADDTLLETTTFHADWSYDSSFDADTDALNTYPCTELAAGQYVPCTMADDVSAKFQIFTAPAVSTRIDVANDGVYQTAWLNLASYTDAIRVVIFDSVNGTLTRRKGYSINSCLRYALYYINAYGGWDTLAVKGNVTRQDNVTRHTLHTDYDNTQVYNRGSRQYVNELAPIYTIHTHYMAEDDSLLMHHLLNSPLVYLHDTSEGQILPINIIDGTTQYQAGNKLYQYTIQAELAQERIRR